MQSPRTRAFALIITLLFFSCISAWLLVGTRLTAPIIQTPEITDAARCAAIENGDLENVSLPITCTLRIHDTETAEFTFKADGGLLVQRGSEVLLALTFDDGGSGSGHFSELAYLAQPTLRPDGFVLKDITFDGYADLQVMTFAGAYNFGYDFYTYNPKTHTFNQKPILKDLVNPGVDTDTKEITYFYKGRGLADTFSAGTYRFKDGMYVLTDTVEQDIATGYDDPNPLYERITSQLKNGVMVVVKKETLTYADVWGE